MLRCLLDVSTGPGVHKFEFWLVVVFCSGFRQGFINLCDSTAQRANLGGSSSGGAVLTTFKRFHEYL